MSFKFFKAKEGFAPYDHFVKLFLPIIPQKIKPNHLTLVRLVFTPVLIVWLLMEYYLPALILFIVLALTDLFDGSIARLRNQITEWGKLWDPIADKLLVGSVVFILLLQLNFSLALLVLGFETAFIVAGSLKKILAKDKEVQANVWGKIKMNLQCFGAAFLILGFFSGSPVLIVLSQVLLYISLFFAALSFISNGI